MGAARARGGRSDRGGRRAAVERFRALPTHHLARARPAPDARVDTDAARPRARAPASPHP